MTVSDTCASRTCRHCVLDGAKGHVESLETKCERFSIYAVLLCGAWREREWINRTKLLLQVIYS